MMRIALSRSQRILLLAGLLLGILLGGCSPWAPEKLIATVAPSPASPAITAPTLTPRPTYTPSGVAGAVASPTPAVTDTPSAVARPATGVALTVLHTNDVYGNIDPCG